MLQTCKSLVTYGCFVKQREYVHCPEMHKHIGPIIRQPNNHQAICFVKKNELTTSMEYDSTKYLVA